MQRAVDHDISTFQTVSAMKAWNESYKTSKYDLKHHVIKGNNANNSVMWSVKRMNQLRWSSYSSATIKIDFFDKINYYISVVQLQ